MPRRFPLAHTWLVLLLAVGGCGAKEAVVDGRTRAEWSAVLADGARPVAERRAAADALGRIAEKEPKAAVQALAAARAKDTDEEVRRRAVVALASAKDAALPALEEALSDASPRVVEAALVALGSLGPAALPAAVAMARLLTGEPSVANQAALALGRLGPGVRPHLWPYLVSESANVRVLVVDALVNAGTNAGMDDRVARGFLLGLASDPDWNVRKRVVAALGRYAVTEPGVRVALGRTLADPNPFVIAAAARAVAEAGPAAADLLPQLVPLLGSEHGPVRAAAAEAVGRLGGKDPAAREAVEQALARETGAARVPLWLAHWRLSGEAGPTVEALRVLMREPNAPAAAEAAGALAELGPDAAPAVPELIALLAVRPARQRAVEALSAVGPKATAARPALESLRNDPNEAFRGIVAEALRKIGAPGDTR